MNQPKPWKIEPGEWQDWRDAPHLCGIRHPSNTSCLFAALRVADCPVGYAHEEWLAALKTLAREVQVRVQAREIESRGRTRRVVVSGGQPGMTTADVYEVDEPGEPGR